MALTVLNDATFSDSAALAGKRDLSHNLALKTFSKPRWDEVLYQQAPNYWLHFFLREKATIKTSKHDEFNWAEMGKIYSKSVVKEVKDVSASVLEFIFTDSAQKYAVNDVIDLGIEYPGVPGINLSGFVTALVEDVAGDPGVQVEMMDPQASAVGVIDKDSFPFGSETLEVALLYNLRGECFERPTSRKTRPEKYTARMAKLSNTCEICDDAANDPLWMRVTDVNGNIVGEGWMSLDQVNLAETHNREVDNYLLFGQKFDFSDSEGYQGKSGTGLIPSVGQFGTVRRRAGALVEQDLRDLITAMKLNVHGPDIYVFHGVGFGAEVQSALDRYTQSGAMYYGPFDSGKGNGVGVNISKYHFLGKNLHFMEYQPFSDPDFLPSNTGGVDYDQFALFLSINKKNTEIIYRKRYDGKTLRNFVDHANGQTMGVPGEPITSNRACAEMFYTTQVGLKRKGVQGDGMMVK